MSRLCPGVKSRWKSQAIWIIRNLPRRCMPLLRYQQPAIWAKKVKNYYVPPPVHRSIGKYHFLLLRDARYTCQDICLGQTQHTIAYAMALHCWAKCVHFPVPHCLVKSVQELWRVMEPLVSFGEEEIFTTTVPSSWTEATSPQSMETMSQPTRNPWCTTPTMSGPIREDPWSWPELKAGLQLQSCRPPQQWRHWQPHHRSLDHTSSHLTPGP